MKCLTDEQLNKLIHASVDQSEKLQWLLHIETCSECRTRLHNSKQFASATGKIADNILQTEDCPEYETLSAYLDCQLSEFETRKTTVHVNACEYCYRDLQKMQSIRAQAAMREPVVVSAQSFAGRKTSVSPWKWAFGTSAGAVAIGVLIAAMPLLQKAPVTVPVADNRPHQVPVATKQLPAEKPPVIADKAPKKEIVAVAPKPKDNTVKAPVQVAKAPEVVLKDGGVQIIRRDGKLELQTKGKGGSVEKLIASYIEQKLRTGKVKVSEPVQLAQGSIAVRSRNSSNKSISMAPKPSSPINKVIISAQPLLEWTNVDLAQDYQVTVTDSDGRIVYESVTDKNRAKINMPLDRGKVYQWRVASRFSDESEWDVSSAAAFKVISNEDLKLIDDARKHFAGSKLALGAVYESLQLEDEANREYKSLAPRARGVEIFRSLNGK